MDPITLIGVLSTFVLVVVFTVLEGGDPTSVLLPAPLILVFGVTIVVCLAGGTMADAKRIVPSLKHAFMSKPAVAADVVPTVVSLAEKARREGMLALEDELARIDDPFLVRGVTMAVDGTDPAELRDILEGEVTAREEEIKQDAKFFNDAGGYAPTIGIVGTVLGLVHVMENLGSPEEIGHLIAAAFVATLWGVLSANAIWLPIGSRLKRLGQLEVARMEVVIEGVAAIQSGSNPRLVAQKLQSLLPASERAAEKKAA